MSDHAQTIRKALDAFVECECPYGAEFQPTCPRHGAQFALSSILIERERIREALEKIAFKTRDWAPTLESCKSIAVEALKG